MKQKKMQKRKKAEGIKKEDLSEKGLVEKNYKDYSLDQRLALDILDIRTMISSSPHARECGELQNHTVNFLRSKGIKYIYQLVQKTEYDLFKIRGFGRKKFRDIKDALRKVDLHLNMRLDPETLAKIESKIPLQDRLLPPPEHIIIIVETDLTEEKIKKLSSKAKDQVEELSAVVRPSAMSAISAFADFFNSNKITLLRGSLPKVSSAGESEKK